MMRRQMILFGLVSVLTTACTSLSAQYATRAPEDRSAAEVAKDQAACEQYTNRHPQRLSYRSCMVARSYAANIDMDELGLTIGVAETEPHAAGEVMRDMVDCDRQAHEAKASDSSAPPLTADRISSTPTRCAGSRPVCTNRATRSYRWSARIRTRRRVSEAWHEGRTRTGRATLLRASP